MLVYESVIGASENIKNNCKTWFTYIYEEVARILYDKRGSLKKQKNFLNVIANKPHRKFYQWAYK